MFRDKGTPYSDHQLELIARVFYKRSSRPPLPCTLDEIAAVLGMPRKKVCQIQTEAIDKLRASMKKYKDGVR